MHYAPNRRFTILLILLGVLLLAFTILSFSSSEPRLESPAPYQQTHQSHGHDPDPNSNLDIASPALPAAPPLANPKADFALPDEHILAGPHIASALENATAKAELGQAAWKLFHTTFARFPDSPSSDEQAALRAYIYLFARLYPCGECAEHFGAILAKFPPQVSSRSAAAAWGCHVHNQVNKSLEKELFDCSKIGDFYHCGCSDGDDKTGKTTEDNKQAQVASDETVPVELEKEG